MPIVKDAKLGHLGERWGRRTCLATRFNGVTGMDVAIIGAGIAGLACADRLAEAGCTVRLFDKGRGPGGRMSTRRIELDGASVTFDHGAQYFTARDPRFAAVLKQWAQKDLAAPWPAAGPDAWVGTPGMDAPVHALAKRHSVEWGRRVERVVRDGGRWTLPGAGAATFDALVIAIPAEQAAALLQPIAPRLAAHAASVPTLPCWTMLAAFDERLPLATDVIRGDDHAALGWAARDSAKPGRPGGERWVVQGGAHWSQRYLEEAAPTMAGRLLHALEHHAGTALAPRYITAHRWRYARTTAAEPAVLWDAGARVGLCGDWCREARVEGAWVSGHTLARAMVR